MTDAQIIPPTPPGLPFLPSLFDIHYYVSVCHWGEKQHGILKGKMRKRY